MGQWRHARNFNGDNVVDVGLRNQQYGTFYARYGPTFTNQTAFTWDRGGSLPRRATRLVAEWISEHSDELTACWEKATQGEEPGTIEPLK